MYLTPTDTNNTSDQELVIRDLHLSLERHSDSNSTSAYHQTCEHYLHAMREFIPEHFSPNFTNPCWYSHKMSPSVVKELNVETAPIPGNSQNIKKYIAEFKRSQGVQLYCLPAFYLAGFAKCGTTTLYELLLQHPQIVPPNQKEGQFWQTFMELGETDIDKQWQTLWYLNHFSGAGRAISRSKQSLTLDASTHTIDRYIPSDKDICHLPSLVFNVLPDTKFIVIMCDPTERSFSHFWFVCSKTRKWNIFYNADFYSKNAKERFHKSVLRDVDLFHSCIRNEHSRFQCLKKITPGSAACGLSYLGVGIYYYHIIRWLNVFPREKFLFLRKEDLITNTSAVMQRVWKFLSLSLVPEMKQRHENANMWTRDPNYSSKFAMLPETRKLLDSFYQPYNELLAHLLSDSMYLWEQ